MHAFLNSLKHRGGVACLESCFTQISTKTQLASYSQQLCFNLHLPPTVNAILQSQLFSQRWTVRQFHSSKLQQGIIDVKVPTMGESITEGSIASLEKKIGDVVKPDEVIAQIETDKVTMEVKYTGSQPGVLKEILVQPEESVTIEQLVGRVDTEGVPVEEAGPPEEAAPSAPAPSPTPTTPAPEQPPTPPPTEQPVQQPGERVERRIKMTRLRKRVAERLKGAQNTYAMLTTFNEVDMSSLMSMRNEYKDQFLERHGVKLGFMSAFVKASAEALKEVPAVNAVIDGEDILYRDYVDISIAVATQKGLVVPVLRNAQNMSFAGIERTIADLGRRAREGTISLDEMAGGTFTISNGGVYGSMLSTPIINPPQSSILGMHAINQRAVVVGKDIVARPMMYLALTYDHRLIDGREAVTFLRRVKDVIEDPRRLILDV
eukprot:TRINITY_DN1121_c2_g1_i1.p1 TRINITY_DN1121_c2_g1~~TRINITY_DN1121_c2_g1_i1.p1  ORF type:complete len:433 (+),score=72.19 TRINITY_DN1121_c2_g1_i1:239-1537(+)